MNNLNSFIFSKKRNLKVYEVVLFALLTGIGIISAYLSSIVPQILVVLVGVCISTWLAYYYPKFTIFILILFGQIIQFELSVVLGKL